MSVVFRVQAAASENKLRELGFVYVDSFGVMPGRLFLEEFAFHYGRASLLQSQEEQNLEAQVC